MKKFLVFLSAIFICTFAIARTIEWYVDDSLYQTTTCDAGDSITPPTAPEKYGYHFVEWSAYTQLEYIESTGTQYIDTGIVPTNKKIGAIVDFQVENVFSNLTGGIFGSAKVDNSDNIQFTINQGKWRYKINSYQAYGNNWDTNRHTISINMSDGTKLDGNIVTSTQYTINSSNVDNSFLFGCNYGINETTKDYLLIGKIYSAKIYDDGVLVRNFVPAKRNSDNALGMYDTVTDTFFTNAGTGEFIAGPEVGGL